MPRWFDVDRNERLKLPIHSGAYPDGSSAGLANNDEAQESNQAKIALALTSEDYLVYVAAAKNTAQLPSPYWSSHFIYHVPRDIANGLMVAGKTALDRSRWSKPKQRSR